MFRQLFIALVSSLFVVCTSSASEELDAILEEFTHPGKSKPQIIQFDTGLASMLTSFSVKDKLVFDNQGKFKSKLTKSFFVSANTPYEFVQKRRFGYFYQAGATGIHLSSQDIGLYDVVDLNTHLNGQFFYLAPVGFINFGHIQSEKNTGLAFKAGAALGLAFLRLKGDIVFFKPEERTRIPISLTQSGFGFTGFLFTELRLNQWALRAYTARAWSSDESYAYELRNTAVDLGITIRF